MRLTRRAVLRTLGLGALASAGGAGFGWLSSGILRVERRDLRLPKWTADGFRVAVLADFHLVENAALERARQAVLLAVDEKPDLIVLVGDFVESSRARSLERLEAFLSALESATCPVAAVLGNHDYWSEQPRKVIDVLEGARHVRLLRNSVLDLDPVRLIGIDDGIAGRQKPEAAKGLGEKNVLALYHEPDFVEELPQNVALQIAGHSHGGQICLPGGKPMMLPRGARRYWGGFYPGARVPLYVTRGVGQVGPQVRFFCPPEVSVLTLRGDP